MLTFPSSTFAPRHQVRSAIDGVVGCSIHRHSLSEFIIGPNDLYCHSGSIPMAVYVKQVRACSGDAVIAEARAGSCR